MASLEKALEGVVVADERALKIIKGKPRVWAALLELARKAAEAEAGGRRVEFNASSHYSRDWKRHLVWLSLGVEGADAEELSRIDQRMLRELVSDPGTDWFERTGRAVVFMTHTVRVA